jgi:hypothetical protein
VVTICPKADTCPKLEMVLDYDLLDYGEAMRKVCAACPEKKEANSD